MIIKFNLNLIRKSINIALALSVMVAAFALLNEFPMHQPVRVADAPPPPVFE